MCWRAVCRRIQVVANSIALRLSGMFTLVALLIFMLIGGALYQQVDQSLGALPGAELVRLMRSIHKSATVTCTGSWPPLRRVRACRRATSSRNENGLPK